MKYSGIGGQAVLEGVMMRNKDKYAIAVRKPDKEIETTVNHFQSISDKYPFLKLPLLRGIVNFVESLYIGMKALSFSSKFFEEEESKEVKEEKGTLSTALTVTFSIVLAIGIFMALPYGLSLLFHSFIKTNTGLTILEGVIRLLILIVYMVGIAYIPDIKRVYMYHGAEHKTINCIENGLPLTVKNVRKMTRKHMRCGTSFIIDVIILSVILFMFIRVENVVLRLVFRILLVPVIAAFAYEFLRVAGRSTNVVVKFLSIPGIWFQGLTTKEPDDKMIEVAIASVEAVFDWKTFIGYDEDKYIEKFTQKKESKLEENSKRKSQKANKKKQNSKNKEVEKQELEPRKKMVEQKHIEQNEKENHQQGRQKTDKRTKIREASKSIENVAVNLVEDEDDEILNALDRFFNNKKQEEKEKSAGKRG